MAGAEDSRAARVPVRPAHPCGGRGRLRRPGRSAGPRHGRHLRRARPPGHLAPSSLERRGSAQRACCSTRLRDRDHEVLSRSSRRGTHANGVVALVAVGSGRVPIGDRQSACTCDELTVADRAHDRGGNARVKLKPGDRLDADVRDAAPSHGRPEAPVVVSHERRSSSIDECECPGAAIGSILARWSWWPGRPCLAGSASARVARQARRDSRFIGPGAGGFRRGVIARPPGAIPLSRVSTRNGHGQGSTRRRAAALGSETGASDRLGTSSPVLVELDAAPLANMCSTARLASGR
jgi:hypothetical protein